MTYLGRIISNLWRPERWGRGWFYRFASSHNTWNDIDILDSFNTIPELNAVINLKARAHSNGIYKHVNKDGQEIDDDLNHVLKNPNFFQAQKEFIRQSVLFHEIFGNEYIYTLFPVGLNATVKALFTLPPNLITAIYEEKTPFFYFDIEPEHIRYVLKYDTNQEKEIPGDEIIHLNDNRVNISSPVAAELLTGESKYMALRPAINNIKMAYE